MNEASANPNDDGAVLGQIPSRLGEYRIIREISGGGMGKIYEAIQEPLKRRVAVKTIRADRLSHETRERFLREQMVLASLHQTHIVPIHAAGQEGILQYFAMPYIEGASLHHVIEAVRQRQGSFPTAKTPTLGALAAQPAEQSTVLGPASTRTQEKSPVPSRPPAGPKPSLSLEYIRSVVEVMVDVAEAFEHVHRVKILHRDLKPSNLMVDTAGQCWIIDFGLAGYLSDAERSVAGTGTADSIKGLTAGGIVGTPAYMAPEQWTMSPGDVRTDVWGLGVTLYELLTLQRAFEGKSLDEIESKVRSVDPPAPHTLVKGVSRDLGAICRKAMQKDPRRRYQEAREFAGDLRRWLSHEPVTARRAWVPRRVWLWSRRNRGWATAIVVGLLACAGLVAGAFQFERNRLEAAEAGQRARQREALLQQMQNVRLTPHQVTNEKNWFDTGWSLVRDAAAIRKDDILRDQAAAFLQGINAHLAKWMGGFEASSVAFDAEGRHLLIGGGPVDEARIWDSKTDQVQTSGLLGAGPVSYRSDGAAWQFVASYQDRFTLLLWNVGKRQLVRELKISGRHTLEPVTELNAPLLEMTAGGEFLAASATLTDGTAVVTAWDGSNGKAIRQINRNGHKITAVSVAPDGSCLALGDNEGQVTCWPLPEGDPILLPARGRTRVNCLAFGRNPHWLDNGDKRGRWLLAGGDAGGAATIWDLGRKVAMTYCHGSYYDIYTVAFSPDGITLASAGRAGTKLWDIATGGALLDLHFSDFMTGIAFTRDAQKLAISMARTPNPGNPHEGIQLWDVEDHRGVQNLRGLVGQISKVCFSRDGQKIAALSQDWQVGIWDRSSGFLRFLFDVAQGFTADNAGLAFNGDGKSFAFAAGSEARLWELESGKATSWRLPDGLVDTLSFANADHRLFLFRVETADRVHSPDSRFPFRRYPRACRVRDLLASPERDLRRREVDRPTWETGYFNAAVLRAEVSPDGGHFTILGLHGSHAENRIFKVYESATGKETWSLPSAGDFRLEVTGKLLSIHPGGGAQSNNLVEMPTGKLLGIVEPAPSAMSPEARLLAVKRDDNFGYALYRRGERTPLVSLGIDTLVEEGRSTFSSDGSLLAWGNRDGTVTVSDLAKVQNRLAAVGLGW